MDPKNLYFDMKSMLEWAIVAKRLEVTVGDRESFRGLWHLAGEEETTFYDDDEFIVDYNRPQYEYILYCLRNLDEIKIVCSEYWDQKPLVRNGGRFDVPRVQPQVRSWYYDSKRVDAYMVEDYYDQMHAMNSRFKVPIVKIVHRVAPMVTDNEILMYAGRDIEALVEESSGDGVEDVSEEDSEDD